MAFERDDVFQLISHITILGNVKKRRFQLVVAVHFDGHLARFFVQIAFSLRKQRILHIALVRHIDSNHIAQETACIGLQLLRSDIGVQPHQFCILFLCKGHERGVRLAWIDTR